MGKHAKYVKALLKELFKDNFIDKGEITYVQYANEIRSQIDGVIEVTPEVAIAVEIEARTPKQSQASIFELLNHPYPHKLLIIVPINQAETGVKKYNLLLNQYKKNTDKVKVIVLAGSGKKEKYKKDMENIRELIQGLTKNSQW